MTVKNEDGAPKVDFGSLQTCRCPTPLSVIRVAWRTRGVRYANFDDASSQPRG